MSRVWVLTSGRTGDDKQSLRLAEALGLPFEEKKIVFNDRARSWRLMLSPSLDSIDQAASSPLDAPWPDMIISSGWRQVPIVRFLKDQNGGRTRLVQMNRPPGPKHFDLVLSPPQFEVPERPNIVRLDWPLQLPPAPEHLVEAATEWKTKLDAYPHPWTVLLLGGNSYPFRIDEAAAKSLFEGARARAEAAGGSLLISTSRRTPNEVVEVFRTASRETTAPVLLYSWTEGSTENPYLAFLAGGDEFVITPDSISMLVEVARLGLPVAIAPHSQYRSLAKSARITAKRWLHGHPNHLRTGLGESVSNIASLLGLKYGRDLASVSRKMIDEGWAADFPEFGGRPGERLPDEDFDRLAERARRLLDDEGNAPATPSSPSSPASP